MSERAITDAQIDFISQLCQRILEHEPELIKSVRERMESEPLTMTQASTVIDHLLKVSAQYKGKDKKKLSFAEVVG